MRAMQVTGIAMVRYVVAWVNGALLTDIGCLNGGEHAWCGVV